MNENGWGFKDFILIFGIIFLAILVTIVIYQINFKKPEATDPIDPSEERESNYTYGDLESSLKLAAQRYQNNNYQGTLESDETWVLSYSLLRKKNYLKKPLMDVKETTKECSGYVIFKKHGTNILYEPYLKCENYTTDGYDSVNEVNN